MLTRLVYLLAGLLQVPSQLQALELKWQKQFVALLRWLRLPPTLTAEQCYRTRFILVRDPSKSWHVGGMAAELQLYLAK